MPVTTTYPGIYIQELPSTSHTIVPAPTSVAVFLGYTHPFKTVVPWTTPTAVFNYTEYERFFGGFFRSAIIPNDVPTAVQQFFNNGGGTAYIVPLQPKDSAGHALGGAVYTNNGVVTFTALEPTTDSASPTQMTVTVKALDPPTNLLADLVFAYGTTVETYRSVQLDSTKPRYVVDVLKASALVSAATPTGTQWANGNGTFTYSPAPAAGSAFKASDFTAQLQAETPLDKLAIFNLLVIPGVFDLGVRGAAISFCETKRAFYIMDCALDDGVNGVPAPPALVTTDFASAPQSHNAAFYFPWLKIPSPADGTAIEVAPSGTVAGIYAKTDNDRGVWKAPAGYETAVNNVIGLVDRGVMTDMQQGQLNPLGINALRTFPGIGTVVFGARTTVAGNVAMEQDKYVPVRRMTLFIEQTLYANLGWAVFEPNDTPLWNAMRTSVESFMLSLFAQGAFQGDTPSQAFHVLCDKTTTTQDDIDLGIVNIVVAFRPLKPAEFVIIKIAQLAGQA